MQIGVFLIWRNLYKNVASIITNQNVSMSDQRNMAKSVTAIALLYMQDITTLLHRSYSMQSSTISFFEKQDSVFKYLLLSPFYPFLQSVLFYIFLVFVYLVSWHYIHLWTSPTQTCDNAQNSLTSNSVFCNKNPFQETTLV